MEEMEEIEGIIDVHAHILPKVDDGSRYMDETKLMLSEAYRQGIRGIIATPHYVDRHNRVDADVIREMVEQVQKAAGNIADDFKIYPGQEIFYYNGITDALESGKALTLAGTRYVLVEFSLSIPFQEIVRAVRRLLLARYIPVLAHIERYRCLRNPGSVEALIHAGAYMQMNYSSLTGLKHISDRRWCRRMVLAGNIHLLGTDMHRLNYRPPETEKAVKWIRKKAGQQCLDRLTRVHPGVVLSGSLI